MTPESFAQMMGSRQQPSPEQVAATEKFVQAATEFEVAQRQLQLDYAWLFCRCKPYYDRDDPGPAQAGCAVHGQQMVTRDGKVL